MTSSAAPDTLASPTREALTERVASLRQRSGPHGPGPAALRQLLEASGPVVATFGEYLSTRPDLLPPAFCAELARTNITWAPARADDVQQVVSTAIGRPLDVVFCQFDAVPFEVRFPVQSHRGRLTPTDAVVVRVVPPAADAAMAIGTPLLATLIPLLADGAGSRLVGQARDFEAAIVDFTRLLARRGDLRQVVTDGLALAEDAATFTLVRPRRPRLDLCTDRLAVWDDLATLPLDAPGLQRSEIAQIMCLVWLRQALLGRAFPEEPRADDFLILDRGQLALADGACGRLSPDTQANLQGYLVATAADDPDWALECLLREFRASPRADRAGLERRFRLEPLPLGDDLTTASPLLGQIVTHWRLARQFGFEPPPHLLSWLRACVRCVRATAAAGDPIDLLREALVVLQLRIAVQQVSRAFGLPNWQRYGAGEMAWRLSSLVNRSPADLVTRGAALLNADRPAPLGVIVGGLLAFGALSLLLPRLGFVLGPDAERAGTVIAVGLGLTLLWTIVRRRGARP